MKGLHDWSLSDDARKALQEQVPKFEPIERRIGSKGGDTQNLPSPPGGSDRGCLCADKKSYSKKCCTGAFQAQGL